MSFVERYAGELAVILGVVGFVSVASLAIFFAVGGPFGSINDWTVGLLAALAGLLALGLSRTGDGSRAGRGWLALGLAGAAVAAIGAGLVISRTTGFVLAGFVESLGFGLVGVWLISRSLAAGGSGEWPRRLARLGVVVGTVMAVGLGALPAVVLRLDDMDTLPGWAWIAFVGWLGIFFLYPAWSLWLGLTVRSRPG